MESNIHYVNQVAIVSSNFDVQIVFRSVHPNVSTDNKIDGNTVDDTIRLVMSREHAASFLDALKTNLEKQIIPIAMNKTEEV